MRVSSDLRKRQNREARTLLPSVYSPRSFRGNVDNKLFCTFHRSQLFPCYSVRAIGFETQKRFFGDAIEFVYCSAAFALHFYGTVNQHPFKEEFLASFASVVAV